MNWFLLRKYSIIFIVIILIIPVFYTIGLDYFQPRLNFESEDSNTLDNNPPLGASHSYPEPNSRSLSVRGNNDWRMHLYAADHNSFTTASGPTNESILWYNTTGDSTYSSPCIADGRVFFGVGDSMKCYYENNGTLAWTMYPDQNVAGTFGICSSPAYANGCIYFGADRIYCVWATNGSIRWKVNKPNIKHGDGTPTLANGKVFIAGSDYKLYCIDQLNGSVYWTFQAKSDYPPAIPDNWGLYASPAVVNGSVYLAACDWYLYQINITQPTSTATANHSFKLGWASYSSPVVVGDKVYVGCSYIDKLSVSRYYCFWASNLTKIWEFYPKTPTGFFGSAGYYNGQLFLGSIDGTLYCLNATSGAQDWNYTLGETWSSPAVTAERFYIGTKDGYIYCFNTTQPSTPEYYWRYYISGEVDTSPSVVPGRVYIGTHGSSGRIYCFGTPDTNPPQVVSHYPINNAENISLSVNIKVTFNELINPSSLTSFSFIVKDSISTPVSGVITYDAVTKTATFNPGLNLKRAETYTITITTAVQDHWSNELDGNSNNISEGSPTDDFSWSFSTSSNNPPTLTNPSLNPNSGSTSTEFEFKVVYTDGDDDSPEVNPGYIRVIIDDELIGRAMSLNTSASSVLRDGKYNNGEEYIYSTTFSTYGQHNYKFVCFDGIDKNETVVYNDPFILASPEIAPISALDAYEDIDLILSLVDKLHDEDSNLRDLMININSSYATISDLNITFNYPNEFNYPSGRNYEIVAINVSDSVHNVTQDVKVNVHAVNDPPKLTGVPNIQLGEDDFYYLDVTPYLTDVDNELEELIVTENSSYATVTEKNITFHYPKDSGILSEYIEINVSDGELFSAQDILVTIIPEGAEIVFLPIPEQNAIEDIEMIIDLTDYVMLTGELDFDDLKLETNSRYCTISGSELQFNYPNSFNYPSGRSSDSVQINVTSLSQVESQTFIVNVHAVNDAPTITAIKTPTSGLENTEILFQAGYQDIDGSEEPVVSVIIGEAKYIMNLTSGDLHVKGAVFELELAIVPGEYEYYYMADDEESQNNSEVKTTTYNLKVIKSLDSDLDTDGDTLPDSWELQFQLDPNDPSDASEDPDGDGYTNLDEFLGSDRVIGGNDSTNPKDSNDFPIKDQTDKGKGTDNTDNNMMIFGLVIGIIIVIIVVLLVLFLRIKNRTKYADEEGYIPEPEHESFEPEESVENEVVEEVDSVEEESIGSEELVEEEEFLEDDESIVAEESVVTEESVEEDPIIEEEPVEEESLEDDESVEEEESIEE
jgi:outer membrane protein assembly factor BamB